MMTYNASGVTCQLGNILFRIHYTIYTILGFQVFQI